MGAKERKAMEDIQGKIETRVLYALLTTANEGGTSRILVVRNNESEMGAIECLKELGFYVEEKDSYSDNRMFFVDWCKNLDTFEPGPALMLCFTIISKVQRLVLLDSYGRNIEGEIRILPSPIKSILCRYTGSQDLNMVLWDKRFRKIRLAELFKIICEYQSE